MPTPGERILNPYVLWLALLLGAVMGYVDGCRHGRPLRFEEQLQYQEEHKHI
jgi:hypothetical protein